MILLYIIISIAGGSLSYPVDGLEQNNILWRDKFYYYSPKRSETMPIIAGGSGCLMWGASVVDAGIEATKRNKSGWLAALLSLIIPGAG